MQKAVHRWKWPLTRSDPCEWPPVTLGLFVKGPGNLTGMESDFDIKVSRKVGRVLISDEVQFVSLADNFTV